MDWPKRKEGPKKTTVHGDRRSGAHLPIAALNRLRHAIIPNVQIAVVDHEDLTRKFIVDVMMYSVNRDILVFEDADGLTAFMDQGKPVDMVLSAVHLPGRSGFELLRYLKREKPHTYFVAMSANPADEIPATELGADAFLARPFALKDLFELVQRFVVDAPSGTDRDIPPSALKPEQGFPR